MEYLTEICVICWQKREELYELSSVAEDNLTFYNKLVTSVSEMNFEEFNTKLPVCPYCCHEINQIYNFHLKCTASKTLFLDFITFAKKLEGNSSNEPKIIEKLQSIVNSVAEISQDEESCDEKLKEENNEEIEETKSNLIENEKNSENIKKPRELLNLNNTIKCIIADDNSQLIYDSQEEFGDEVEYIKMEFLSDNEQESEVDEMVETNNEIYFDNDIDDPDYNPDNLETSNFILIKEEPLSSEEKENQTQFHCAYCSKTFSNEIYLNKHIQNHIQKSKAPLRIFKKVKSYPYKCEKCSKRFKKKILLNRHMEKHPEEPKFKCNIGNCVKKFWGKIGLEKHKKIHETKTEENEKDETEIFQCNFCEKIFNKKSYLRVHLERHSDKRFQCEFCLKVYSDRSNLYRHRMLHIKGPETFPCPICKRVFNRKEHLNRHINSHNQIKKYMCELCGKGFTTKHMVDLHRLRHNEGPLKCQICPLRFQNEAELESHQISHESEFQCHLCSKRFKREDFLMDHIQRHNSGYYNFKCEICDKNFANKTNLVRHNLVHTKERNFECNLCNKRLATKYNLQMHLKNHTEDKMHNCELCKKRFPKKYLLLKHQETPCV